MDIDIGQSGGVTVVAPKGRLDSATSPELEQRLLPLAGASGGAVVVDCAELGYVSSAGLRVLLMAAKSARGAGARIALAALQPNVRQVFDISGFSSLFEIHDSAAAATDALAAPPA
jgi:anti-sigma B factor antagonist